MKKIASVLLLLFVFSSCVPETYIPFGIWESERPSLLLYIDANYQQPTQSQLYLGSYVTEETRRKIFVRFGNGPRFSIYCITALREDGNIGGDGRIMSGTWRRADNEIHYTLTTTFQGRTGYSVIIFNNMEYYESINPADWFPYAGYE
jgi:hypothetical protein